MIAVDGHNQFAVGRRSSALPAARPAVDLLFLSLGALLDAWTPQSLYM
jgi:hypothetical protein